MENKRRAPKESVKINTFQFSKIIFFVTSHLEKQQYGMTVDATVVLPAYDFSVFNRHSKDFQREVEKTIVDTINQQFASKGQATKLSQFTIVTGSGKDWDIETRATKKAVIKSNKTQQDTGKPGRYFFMCPDERRGCVYVPWQKAEGVPAAPTPQDAPVLKEEISTLLSNFPAASHERPAWRVGETFEVAFRKVQLALTNGDGNYDSSS